MHKSAQLFLSLRALGAPANVIMLAMQGIFRGFKDTKTPVIYIGSGNLSAVVLLPLLIYGFQLGITGAAISTVASQTSYEYLTTREGQMSRHVADDLIQSFYPQGGFEPQLRPTWHYSPLWHFRSMSFLKRVASVILTTRTDIHGAGGWDWVRPASKSMRSLFPVFVSNIIFSRNLYMCVCVNHKPFT
ncbi:hypothetical protein BRADI_3g60646v3 [Brachypodium distachyon]|uniref:Uncharacterized protein n=1 Tax=Brachypodium distachyon TaxID=15368 RepID=A0A0Q3FST9_BRADI|nr:hypothetical protein BRADI_3g60646v3 [Brachypodium distachyon]